MGERLPTLLSEFMLPWEGVERRLSLGGGGLAGSPGTVPGRELTDFFLLEGGMREDGRTEGTGSFSRARYTRCMAYRTQNTGHFKGSRKDFTPLS